MVFSFHFMHGKQKQTVVTSLRWKRKSSASLSALMIHLDHSLDAYQRLIIDPNKFDWTVLAFDLYRVMDCFVCLQHFLDQSTIGEITLMGIFPKIQIAFRDKFLMDFYFDNLVATVKGKCWWLIVLTRWMSLVDCLNLFYSFSGFQFCKNF